jgi:hypothetical protein
MLGVADMRPIARSRYGPRLVEYTAVRWPVSLWTSAPPITGKHIRLLQKYGVMSIRRTLRERRCCAATAAGSAGSADRRGTAHAGPARTRRAIAWATQSIVPGAATGTSRTTVIRSTECGNEVQPRT